ncbi:MAG: alpha/beta hydrolase [Coriobacteriales bacterium]|jgi:pimeloyl-ACP methyl ester carboxylesterase|nr:alpha/beta hydrolase [Coriobacteriales bacterium]
MTKLVYFEEYLDTGAPQYLLHYPVANDAGSSAPVLLLVHGGPGFSESFMGYRLKALWGDLFNLVFWDQRGCGKSLAASTKPVAYPITINEVMSDMHAVVRHLKKRYRVKRIAMLGHSWGSILGSRYALEHPDDLLLYVGTGQVVEMHENELRAYNALRERIVAAGSTKDLEALPRFEDIEFLARGDMPHENQKAFGRLRQKYNLVVKIDLRTVAMFVRNPCFAFSDFSFLKKDVECLRWDLVEYLGTFNLRDWTSTYRMPVAYLLGANDYQAVTSLAVEYFEDVQAPRKLLRVIPKAGHNTMIDAPKDFAAALREARGLIER